MIDSAMLCSDLLTCGDKKKVRVGPPQLQPEEIYLVKGYIISYQCKENKQSLSIFLLNSNQQISIHFILKNSTS